MIVPVKQLRNQSTSQVGWWNKDVAFLIKACRRYILSMESTRNKSRIKIEKMKRFLFFQLSWKEPDAALLPSERLKNLITSATWLEARTSHQLIAVVMAIRLLWPKSVTSQKRQAKRVEVEHNRVSMSVLASRKMCPPSGKVERVEGAGGERGGGGGKGKKEEESSHISIVMETGADAFRLQTRHFHPIIDLSRMTAPIAARPFCRRMLSLCYCCLLNVVYFYWLVVRCRADCLTRPLEIATW